jgi:hypothetical protein
MPAIWVAGISPPQERPLSQSTFLKAAVPDRPTFETWLEFWFLLGAHGGMSDVSVILQALSNMPDWVRQDLAAKDAAVRQRAEETLAAIIAAAVNTKQKDA